MCKRNGTFFQSNASRDFKLAGSTPGDSNLRDAQRLIRRQKLNAPNRRFVKNYRRLAVIFPSLETFAARWNASFGSNPGCRSLLISTISRARALASRALLSVSKITFYYPRISLLHCASESTRRNRQLSRVARACLRVQRAVSVASQKKEQRCVRLNHRFDANS